MSSAIALDVGSSSIKAALLDLDRLSVGAPLALPFPDRLPANPGRHEVDAELVSERCRTLLEQLAAGQDDLEALILCGQHGGYVPFDLVSRRAIGPFISWRDERTTEVTNGRSFFDALRDEIGEAALLRIGRELAPGGTLALLTWLKRHGHRPSAAVPLGIAEYVLSRLARDADPQIELTCAVGMVNVETLASPRELYARLGLGDVPWPRLTRFRDRAGTVRLAGRDVAVFPVVGDHQCALAGTLLGERELSINISTGSQVSLLARHAQRSATHQTRCYFDDLLLNTLTHLPAGRALNVFVDLLTELPRRRGLPIEDAWTLLGDLVDESQHTDLCVRTTFFKGPLGERGAIENIGVANLTAGNLMRGAIDDMASNYREAARRLAGDDAWDRIALSGGLAQKLAPLRAAIGRAFAGRPTRLSTTQEETLLGMLALALVATGRAGSLAQANELLKDRRSIVGKPSRSVLA